MHAAKVLYLAKKDDHRLVIDSNQSVNNNTVHDDQASVCTLNTRNSLENKSVASYVRRKLMQVQRLPTCPKCKSKNSSSIYPVPDGQDPPKKGSSSRTKGHHSKQKSTLDVPFFAGTADDIEFFLPKVKLDSDKDYLTNGNEENNHKLQQGDPTALSNVFRPWQVEFLKSVRITTSSQLIFASKSKSLNLAKVMVKWRKEKQMKSYKSKSCSIALHIWIRTIKAKIKSSLNEQSMKNYKHAPASNLGTITQVHK